MVELSFEMSFFFSFFPLCPTWELWDQKTNLLVKHLQMCHVPVTHVMHGQRCIGNLFLSLHWTEWRPVFLFLFNFSLLCSFRKSIFGFCQKDNRGSSENGIVCERNRLTRCKLCLHSNNWLHLFFFLQFGRKFEMQTLWISISIAVWPEMCTQTEFRKRIFWAKNDWLEFPTCRLSRLWKKQFKTGSRLLPPFSVSAAAVVAVACKLSHSFCYAKEEEDSKRTEEATKRMKQHTHKKVTLANLFFSFRLLSTRVQLVTTRGCVCVFCSLFFALHPDCPTKVPPKCNYTYSVE